MCYASFMLKKLRRLLLGKDEPNEAQIKFFAQTSSDLGKAVLIGSVTIYVIPSDKPIDVTLVICGIILGVIFLCISSRLLKEVKHHG